MSEEYGFVKSRWKSVVVQGQHDRSKVDVYSKTIIHIQDAHDNLQAQENIANLIKTCMGPDLQPISLIAVEGAVGKIKTDIYRDFPVEEARNSVMLDYLRKGIFSGAEYGAIIADLEVDLFGAEDEALFKKNFNDFYESTRAREAAVCEVQKLLDVFVGFKSEFFSKDLLVFDNLMESCIYKNSELATFLPSLYQYINELKVDLYSYPILMQCFELIKKKKEQTIDVSQFFAEIKSVSQEIAFEIADTDIERKILKFEHYLLALKSMARLEFTNHDSCEFQKYSQSIEPKEVVDFLNEKACVGSDAVEMLESIVARANTFYSDADKRSVALLENTLKRMDESGETEAFLIAGGYHSDVIEDECRKRNVSYLRITPAISDLKKTVPYLKKMTGELFPINPNFTSNTMVQSPCLIKEEN